MRRVAISVLFASFVLGSCRSSRFLCDASAGLHAPRNFGRVSATLYRGGQPQSCSELAFLSSSGVRSILKLNDRRAAVDEQEKQEATRLGLRIESFSFNARTIGTKRTCGEVRHALAFLEDERNWPVYVHCTAGKDRTGYIVGLYERTALHRSAADVLKELHDYGHRGARAIALPQIHEELERDTPLCAAESSGLIGR